jgi:NADP-dependent 3-hydroxy acid dehydrogenase YdfG
MAGALAGKIALVTGSSSGIGAAAAIALAGAGAQTVLVARRVERLNDLVRQIEDNGGSALAMPGDVTDEQVANRVIADTLGRFGRLDILINSAGMIDSGGIESTDSARYRRVLETNFMSALYTSRAVIAPMRAQGGGDIVNISSIAGRRAAVLFNAYTASKFALTGMTEAMRIEVGKQGIRVCIIEPGATTTEVHEGISDPTYKKVIHEHVNKEGAMKPEDVAAAILMVVSLPPRANVSMLLIRPTIDTAAS